MLLLPAQQNKQLLKKRIVKFDTNAKLIGVDNQCSACISPYIEDFIGPLEDTNKTIKGFAGAQTNNPKIGTLRWQCGQMIQRRYIPLRSPIYTTSHHAN